MTLSVVLLSAVCATPAFANFFSNQYTNIHLNVGSAPSPTPREVRENRLPQVVQAAPSGADAVAENPARNAGNPAVIDHASSHGAEAKTVSTAELSR